ncbi:hypothetical protein M501DRAFT_28796 [Patellaria atrata CBS 101060]|uniref:Telomerase reverse transcriptase n=1 Tax=Patellaria atrata CBS 101060 TaxID=1346257 RepID=A0A9P4SHV4_9PEZI|nr:hypothetical protein M501DRAFT_28796 [Patellaria atrata CBS 101060]
MKLIYLSDVLNRYRDVNDVNQTVHVMKYIFPRQFGLHNVFTSTVDFKESAHIFKDYTLREQEIAVLQQRRDIKRAEKEKTDMCQQKIPKRLRGMTVELVTKLRKLHQRCSYAAILQYYCPISVSSTRSANDIPLSFKALDKSRLASHALPKEVGNSTGNVATQYVNVEEPKYTELACSVSEVSAFCRAVLLNIVPHGFWGDTETYRQNEAIISKYIDMFIRARKSESLSIHEIIQNFKVRSSIHKRFIKLTLVDYRPVLVAMSTH